MKLFWTYSGPMLCHDFGGGAFGGGGATKTSESQTKDNSATAGGDNYGGGENNTVTVNSDATAIEGLKTAQVFAQSGFDLLKAFQTSNTQLADNTNARLSDLAQSQASGGATVASKTMLVALAIGGAVIVLPSLLRRK